MKLYSLILSVNLKRNCEHHYHRHKAKAYKTQNVGHSPELLKLFFFPFPAEPHYPLSMIHVISVNNCYHSCYYSNL